MRVQSLGASVEGMSSQVGDVRSEQLWDRVVEEPRRGGVSVFTGLQKFSLPKEVTELLWSSLGADRDGGVAKW